MRKQVVVVTGAGIGIGKAVAERFGRDGCHVIVTDILKDEGAAVARAIVEDGGSAEFKALDVRSTEQTDELVADLERRCGGVDVIVANAGIAHRQPFETMTDQQWDLTFDIDLKGIFRLVRAAVPGMKQKRKGAIVAVSSIMGVAYGWDEHVHYSAAKSGVVGLVRALAVEFASSGIRANAVAPGFIRTAQVLSEQHSLGAAGLEEAGRYIPMGRPGEPEDIADVIAFLASDDARYMTGQTITVDGGLVVGRY